MEENDLSMDQLRAVYKAQTEAYLDFNLALINILTKQNELLNKVENLEDITDAEFKNISREYYALEKIFTNFQSAQQIRDNELSNTVEENIAQMSHFGAEFSNLKNEIITKLENELSIIGKDIKQLKTLHFDEICRLKINFLSNLIVTIFAVATLCTFFNYQTGKKIH